MRRIVTAGLAALLMSCSNQDTAREPHFPVFYLGGVSYDGIEIEGPPAYTYKILRALDLIYDNDPQNWGVVCNNLTLIRLNPPSSIQVYSGICNTDENETIPGRYYQPVEWVAGEIVHDAWHRKYYQRGEVYEGWEGEKKCMERQNEFFRKIGYPPLDIEAQLKSRYWEIERDW